MNTEGLKVLLVDDTQIVLEHLAGLMSALQQVSQTKAVTNAEEGLALLRDFEPDVLILDINMPGMSGVEMLRRMSLSQPTGAVVVMLTNNTFAGYRDECMRLGADFFLDKSRDFQMIPGIIDDVYQGRMVQL
ncbi:response regulator transcription factor [Sediminibacterium soli]|uniref:response regulator transcription factor n=1 Tax=Sediminibacterium soli TaxID=2698829 RepID=UPI00137B3F0A|nr:response regulator transcription factor [Sediminibacterium soli]NCI46104.1 response regulator transcription factor [Sediminibacterium soli]